MKPNRQRQNILRKSGITLYETSFSKWFPWKTYQAYNNIIDNYKPDFIITWMSRATHLCPKGSFIHLARLGGYYPLKYYEECDHLIAITKELLKYLKQGSWNSFQVHYIQNFAFLLDNKKLILRSKFKTPNSKPLILALGRFHNDKAFDVLIKSFIKVPNSYLWLAGDGKEKKILKDLIKSKGLKNRVRFLGWQSKISSFIKTANIVVFPSRIEPHGTVTLETWGYNKPLVSTRSLGPSSMVENQKTGLLVGVNNVFSLSQALNLLIYNSSLSKHLVYNSQQEFKLKYKEKIVVEVYLKFLRRIYYDLIKDI